MKHISFRMGQHNFEDVVNFPEGFVKSGLFSDAEEEILVYWGETMHGLDIGELFPENQEEEHFVRVLDNPKLANSSFEKIWLKYRKIANNYLPKEQ
ncbi:DUF413 domain-containing protein [Vibrio sp. HN007]|uniref:DUF413 domain-containing protein n=1 Tax=Vibrio iocasae TaxID=3098914 RepID=UPI0035D50E42